MEKREIKFRAKSRRDGKIVYGSYHKCAGRGEMYWPVFKDGNRTSETRTVDFNSYWILELNLPDSVGWDVSDSFRAIEVDPETVNEFTGLHDKNGKEIYEGDIYQVESGNTYQVMFVNGAFVGGKNEASCLPLGWDTTLDDYGNNTFFESENDWFEVIGNIYANPELLTI